MFLWYIGNQNSYREISDRFDIGQGTAHKVIVAVADTLCSISDRYICWSNATMKESSRIEFLAKTGIDQVIGAIDGCHIQIIKPVVHGPDYFNRLNYYSILLQAICDSSGVLLDIFVGAPGRIHDSRLLRLTPFFEEWENKMHKT